MSDRGKVFALITIAGWWRLEVISCMQEFFGLAYAPGMVLRLVEVMQYRRISGYIAWRSERNTSYRIQSPERGLGQISTGHHERFDKGKALELVADVGRPVFIGVAECNCANPATTVVKYLIISLGLPRPLPFPQPPPSRFHSSKCLPLWIN